MTKFVFKQATKAQAKLRLGLGGPPGSGKTMTALRVARALVGPNGKVAVVDTEHGSASKYAATPKHPADGKERFDFDTLNIKDNYDPRQVAELIEAAHEAGYDVLIFDSFTHFWNGPGGFLEQVDAEAKRQAAASRNQYAKPDGHSAWKAVDPIYKRMVQAILGAPLHVIITMRAKMDHERREENGRTKIVKLGIANEMRDNFPYELDVEGMMTMDNDLVIGKTRCSALRGQVIPTPGKELAATLKEWLDDGAPAAPYEPPRPPRTTCARPSAPSSTASERRATASASAASSKRRAVQRPRAWPRCSGRWRPCARRSRREAPRARRTLLRRRMGRRRRTGRRARPLPPRVRRRRPKRRRPLLTTRSRPSRWPDLHQQRPAERTGAV